MSQVVDGPVTEGMHLRVDKRVAQLTVELVCLGVRHVVRVRVTNLLQHLLVARRQLIFLKSLFAHAAPACRHAQLAYVVAHSSIFLITVL